ncbi:hypothetical protein K431DRAFT_347462 [Polychaeton citri CBS 116435]|uniref:Transcription factor IIIC 90kDa subunit N-terminal domain-containing protein n=1 Tax=Polychaeton citri CBS 116435 TaxID=1314669 RepID=A0A9P4Q3X6_9PEZI|nr:hypothetical protein K431DRAFT_347462 [Polychaeton citri CBS 116435]
MSAKVRLPFWPSSLDCVSWSQDNLIAVGGGENLAILVPNCDAVLKGGIVWEATLVPANEYTHTELPQRDPLSFANFSFGEEIAHRQILSLKWSRSGFGRHKRCVLAALDSSHALSIWASDGMPDQPIKWRRKLVLNRTVFEHYKQRNPDFTDFDLTKPEAQVTCQRISCFDWGQSAYTQTLTGCDDGQLIAVATGRNDILFIEVRPPAGVLNGFVTDWSASVVGALNGNGNEFDQAQTMIPNIPSLIEYLVLSDWKTDDTATKTCFGACIARGQMVCFQARTSIDNDGHMQLVVEDQVLCVGDHPLKGPLRILPGHEAALVAFEPDAVCIIKLDFARATSERRVLHDLDGRWDEVSGLTFTTDRTGLLRLHITSHLSSASALTACVGLDTVPTTSVPSWQQAIVESKTAFRASHDFTLGIIDKTSGIAASPMGDMIATCAAFFPSNGLNYTIPTDQHCIVSITPESEMFTDTACFNKAARTPFLAEAKLLHLRTMLLQAQLGSPDEPNTLAVTDLIGSVTTAWDSSCMTFEIAPLPPPPTASPRDLVRFIRMQLFTNAEAVKRHCLYLLSLATSSSAELRLVQSQIVQVQVSTALAIAKTLQIHSELSLVVLNNYCKLSKLLDSAEYDTLDQDSTEIADEKCEFCGRAILFENLKWARCENGHQFYRCSASLLAIQGPRLAKHCGLCNVCYVNEVNMPQLRAPKFDQSHVPQAEGPENARPINLGHNADTSMHPVNTPAEPLGSYIRVLLAALDCCIYCGGKFVS